MAPFSTTENADRGWLVILGAGLLLSAAYMALPYGRFAGAFYVAITVVAALVIALGVRRPPRPLVSAAWYLITAALLLAAIGHGLWYRFDLQGLDPFPSVADLFYLGHYLPLILAFWLLARRRGHSGGSFVDALIVGISAGVLGWALLIVPYIYDPTLTLGELTVAAAYPVADLILLPLALHLVFLHRTRALAHRFLLLAVLAYLAADTLYAHGNSEAWYQPGGFTDSLWLIAYALLAAAAWHPSAHIEPETQSSSAEISARRLVLLGIASVLVPALLLTIDHRNFELVRPVAIASIVLFVLVICRMDGLMRRMHHQARVLEQLSMSDPLTGALNRRGLDNEIRRELPRAERTGSPLQLAVLDLDHFKQYNDTHGHEAGDELLIVLVRQWQRILRPSDALARFGGEEFIALLPDTDAESARRAIERLRRSVPHGQTCSAGIAQFVPGETLESLIRRADAALYAAKDAGRDRVVVADLAAGMEGEGAPRETGERDQYQ